MKNLLFVLPLILMCYTSKSQTMNLGLGYGSGYVYIIENIQGTNIEYGTPWVMNANLSLNPNNSYFGLSILCQYSSAEVQQNFGDFSTEGSINTLNIGLLLEHIQDSNKINLGYAFGLGISRESFALFNPRNVLLPCIHLQGVADIPISDRASIRLKPQFLWNDPISTFSPNRWINGGEDLNAILTVEFNYNFGPQ